MKLTVTTVVSAAIAQAALAHPLITVRLNATTRPDDFRRATQLLREKCGSVIISDGANGAWFDGEFVAAPKIDALDTTAAGDTLLAEYCFRAFAERNADAPRWAVAAGSAACLMPGGEPPSVQDVKRIFSMRQQRKGEQK